MEGDGGGHAPGIIDLAAARQRVLALGAGSLGDGLAEARGDVIMVRYADDAVLGFENRDEAERLRRELQEQLRQVGLELHPEKTRMIEFGRFAESHRKRRGEGKPETFDFLGFTHMCGRTRQRAAVTGIPRCGDSVLAADVEPAKPKGPRRLGAHEPTGAPMDSERPHHASLSECTL